MSGIMSEAEDLENLIIRVWTHSGPTEGNKAQAVVSALKSEGYLLVSEKIRKEVETGAKKISAFTKDQYSYNEANKILYLLNGGL